MIALVTSSVIRTLDQLSEMKSVKGIDLTIYGPVPLGTFILMLKKAKRVKIIPPKTTH